jgi:hypothetical protein
MKFTFKPVDYKMCCTLIEKEKLLSISFYDDQNVISILDDREVRRGLQRDWQVQ